MDCLLDTVVIIRHFTSSGKIAKNAKKILSDNKNEYYLSVISLMEIMYLAERERIPLNLKDSLDFIKSSENYHIVNLIPEIIIEAQNIDFFELHDRLILATASYLEIPIVSSDKKFTEIKDIEVIW